MQFSKRLGLTLGISTLLLVGLASNHLHRQSKNQQLAQQEKDANNLSFVADAKTSLATIPGTRQLSTNFLNPLVSQQRSNQNISQQTTPPSGSYPVIDEWKKYKFSVADNQVLSPGKLPNAKVNFNPKDLLTVLVNTRKYFQDYANEDPDILRPGLLGNQGVTVPDVLKTLDFMIGILQEDIANNRPTRLQDPNFINSNFRVINWSAHNPATLNQKRLRITKYAVFTHPGSRTKTSTYNIPIYSLKDNLGTDKFYTRYTKQDVLSGIYEPNGREFGKVEPLAYLTRTGLEEALMEGTILINFTDGSKAFFNVDRNNEMSYIRGLKPTEQKRYWYFRKVDEIKGYGYKIDAKISIKPGVTFAGDVLNIGLGKLIVIEHTTGGRKQLRMGIIADTGGAFLPNLHQLDFLAGIFQNKKDFGQHIRQLPEYATAYILVKK